MMNALQIFGLSIMGLAFMILVGFCIKLNYGVKRINMIQGEEE